MPLDAQQVNASLDDTHSATRQITASCQGIMLNSRSKSSCACNSAPLSASACAITNNASITCVVTSSRVVSIQLVNSGLLKT